MPVQRKKRHPYRLDLHPWQPVFQKPGLLDCVREVRPEGLGSRPYRLGLRLAEALEQVLHDLDADERETVMDGFRDYMVPRCNPGCARCLERPTKWHEADTLLRQILGLL